MKNSVLMAVCCWNTIFLKISKKCPHALKRHIFYTNVKEHLHAYMYPMDCFSAKLTVKLMYFHREKSYGSH